MIRTVGVLLALVATLFGADLGHAQELSEGTPAPESESRFGDVPAFDVVSPNTSSKVVGRVTSSYQIGGKRPTSLASW